MKLSELSPAAGSAKARKEKEGAMQAETEKQRAEVIRDKTHEAAEVYSRFRGRTNAFVQTSAEAWFTNIFAKQYVEVNVEQLNRFDENTEVTAELLKEKGVISKIKDSVVILGRGELEKSLTVKAKRFSNTAREKITKAGGKVEVV